jgi:hypothetical protein
MAAILHYQRRHSVKRQREQQQQEWAPEQYEFVSNENYEGQLNDWDDSNGDVLTDYLQYADKALTKLQQHESRRAKTPQRLRDRHAWQ